MNILILGGTGAMGIHLVSLLSQTNNNIVVTSRKYVESKDSNVKYLQGNAMNIDFIKSILSTQWDIIIDFMAYTTVMFESRINMLLNATSHYIFLSSARVYANSLDLITEDSPRLIDCCDDLDYLSTDEYALSKGRQENILMSLDKKNWTIIRPYVTYAENRLQLGVLEKEHWLYRALIGKTILFSSEINSKFSTFTYGLDVAKGISSLLGKQEAFGEAFHITANHAIQWNDILTIYLDVLEEYIGMRPSVLLVDYKKLIALGYSEAQIKYDRLYDRRFDNAKISKFVKISDFYNTNEGLKTSIRAFLSAPSFSNISWKIEAKKDKLTKEFTSPFKIEGLRNKLVYLICRFTNFK